MAARPPRPLDSLVTQLGYDRAGGFVRTETAPRSGTREMLIQRARRHLPGVSAIYFADDVPLIYFAESASFTAQQLMNLHQKVWNDSRVPMLFAVDSSHLRIYDAWGEPTNDSAKVDDEEKRLIRKLSAMQLTPSKLSAFSRERLDTGAYVADLKSEKTDRFVTSTRCDTTLFENLKEARDQLVAGDDQLERLSDSVVHVLLIRSLLILNLEHRSTLGPAVYGQYHRGARRLIDVYEDRDDTYRLFASLATRFNGDLMPIQDGERAVTTGHLSKLRDLLSGTIEMRTKQCAFWPMYDFSVIPIQLISSVYERLLHLKDAAAAKKEGVYFTSYPTVEIMMNEVLPWPDKRDDSASSFPRVIDPSCGSGVFLVEAFRRIVAHWRHRHPEKMADVDTLSGLMTKHIFGIDKNALAVRVTSFSLYLAMLDDLDEQDVWGKLRFPKLTDSSRGSTANLTKGNAFVRYRPMLDAVGAFDLVVGNPPWRRGKLPKRIVDCCAKANHPVASELAHPFMWLAGDLAPMGRAAMLTPSKWLFNRERPDVDFRRNFLTQNYVESVVNLSALVGGDNRQFTANAPAAAVVFRRLRPAQPNRAVLYYTPRPGSLAGAPMALLIDAADVKWIPRAEAEQCDDVWKVVYIGSWRDLRLARRLASCGNTLTKFIGDRENVGWHAARGFQPDGLKSSANDDAAKKILAVPFVEAHDVARYELRGHAERTPWATDSFSRTGTEQCYDGPHVLLKQGLENMRLCAAFVPHACSFRDTITGICAPAGDSRMLKALTVYINSSLATYYLLVTSSTWGIDRRKLNKNEVLGLPSQVLHDEATVVRLAELYDEHRKGRTLKEQTSVVERMDLAVFDALDIAPNERIIVRDTLRVGALYIDSGKRASVLGRPSIDALKEYAAAFKDTLDSVLGSGAQHVVPIIRHGEASLCVVSFRVASSAAPGTPVVIEQRDDLRKALDELDAILWSREGINVYRRRHVRVFEDGVVSIVKPAEARFWTAAAAFHDADETIGQVLGGTRGSR